MWDLQKLKDRRAELELGLTQLKEQYQRAYYLQSGAIAQIDEQIAEMENPQIEAAAQKRHRRKAKRFPEGAQEVELPSVAVTSNGAGD